MNLDEAKEQFIHTWGALGTNWGINRTMAQIHALLMISPAALSSEEIQNRLKISIGNANMNLRELIAWGLVYKELKAGDRKEYFSAHKDMWEVAQCIIRERKRRELDPVRKAIDALSNVSGNKNDPELKAYLEVVQDIQNLAGSTDKIIDKVITSDKNWFLKKFLRFFI